MQNSSTHIDRETIISSFVWKMLERIFSQGINLIVQIILARILLPEDFGSLAIIVAITNFLTIFVQSGLSTAIIQKDSIDNLDISTLLTSSLVITIILYIGVFISSTYLSDYYSIPELKWALRVLGLVLFLNAISSIQTAVLTRKMAFRKMFIRTALAVPISGCVGIVLALKGFGVWALVIHNVVNMIVVVIFMSFDEDMGLSLRFSLTRAKVFYAFSSKILITNLIAVLHDTIRTMVIGKKYTTGDLAYYDKALTYSGYITLIVNSSISSILLNTFSRKQNNLSELKSMARRSISLSSFFMFPVLLGVAAVSNALVEILLTSKWLPCVPFLVIFCVLRLPGSIITVDKQVYYAIGRSDINLVYEAVLFVINVLTLFFSINYGVFAVAIGATIIELLGSVAICCISAKIYNYSLAERITDLIKPFICTGVMVAFVWAVRYIGLSDLLTLLLQISIGVLVYCLMSKFLKNDSMEYTFNTIRSMIRKKVTQ